MNKCSNFKRKSIFWSYFIFIFYFIYFFIKDHYNNFAAINNKNYLIYLLVSECHWLGDVSHITKVRSQQQKIIDWMKHWHFFISNQTKVTVFSPCTTLFSLFFLNVSAEVQPDVPVSPKKCQCVNQQPDYMSKTCNLMRSNKFIKLPFSFSLVPSSFLKTCSNWVKLT